LAGDSVHVSDGVGEKTSTCSGESGGNEEVSNAEGELTLGVEEGEVESETWKETGFDGTKEETADEETSVGLDDTGKGGDDSPSDSDEGN
jgi:hypothetical protein